MFTSQHPAPRVSPRSPRAEDPAHPHGGGSAARTSGWPSARPDVRPLVPPRVRRRARALLWRHRFGVAALLLGLAAAIVVHRLSPLPDETRAVVVAATALPAGAVLAAPDLSTVDLPVAAVAEGWHEDQQAVVGRTLALAVTAGTVLGDPLLTDDTTAGPPGTVVAGVRLAEPALAALLSPGMRVDILAAGPSLGADPGEGTTGTGAVPAATLAARALVLPRPSPETQDAGLLGGTSTDSSTDLVLVAVTPGEAALLAGVSGQQSVSAVVVQ